MKQRRKPTRRATILVMIVGLLATLFLIVTAYITLARFDKLTAASFRKSRTADDVLANVNTVVLSSLRQSLADGNGNVLAGGRIVPGTAGSKVLYDYSPVNIAGQRGSSWVSQIEPVRDVTLPLLTDPFHQLRIYKQISSTFNGAISSAQALPLVGWQPEVNWPLAQAGLMLEDGNDRDLNFELTDVLRNVRQPFMDADADGVPDTRFVGTASLTELANAVAGVAVRAPVAVLDASGNTVVFDPSAIGDPNTGDTLALAWKRYDNQSQYDVPVKVIANGGLVALASPGDSFRYNVWNRQFTIEMFNWVRYKHGQESDDDPLTYLRPHNTLLNDVSSSAAQIEPFLRHRGGRLASYPEETFGAEPAALRALRDQFRRTFRVIYQPQNKLEPWQRFNLASVDPRVQEKHEWAAWRDASTLDPNLFNEWWGTSAPQPGEEYQRQHLLTTISNSDELARDIDPIRPNPDPASPTPDRDMGIYTGQLKFYLGDIGRAFDSQGNFVDVAGGTAPRGRATIERLAHYYYEMLSDYDGWGDVGTNGPQAGKTEAVSLRQQAFMLAVNTVAAAAPRRPLSDALHAGFIDVVYYSDTTGGRAYTGYGPQPFITKVVAYNKAESTGNPPQVSHHTALAVELYYPDDPGPNVDPVAGDLANNLYRFNNPNDPYAVNLAQFAVSVNDNDAHLVILSDRVVQKYAPQLQTPVRLSGRRFVSFSITDQGSNGEFDAVCDGVINTLPVSLWTDPNHYPPRDGITVKLWRQSLAGLWYQVDSFPLVFATRPDDNQSWLATGARDASRETHLGGDWNNDGAVDPVEAARWRMVGHIGVGTPLVNADPSDSELDRVKSLIGKPPLLNVNQAPTIPLYTMNAGAGLLSAPPAAPVHGDYRPKSFPTVGFLLFVPRFSHTGHTPMSEVLRKQWEDTDRHAWQSATGLQVQYPADFGHMPIFDNRQAVKPASYFDNSRAGTVPWGQLVFDYFTTLNPDALDDQGRRLIDPLRVPGRIDINAAPWYVLAGLPLINPLTDLMLQLNPDGTNSYDPAFWSIKSGVLVGQAPGVILPDGTFLRRFDDTRIRLMWDGTVGPPPPSAVGWWRLGRFAAQAIASYRDRIRYVSDDHTTDPRADLRNGLDPSPDPIDPNKAFYRKDTAAYTMFGGYTYGEIRRGTASSQHGFLTLGELANVEGFDSTVPNGPSGAGGYAPLGPKTGMLSGFAPDYFKAVSMLALLDTEFLTTRSNTFTVYVSVMDRKNPQASIRSQLTVDRSNLLPRLVLNQNGAPVLQDTNGDGVPDAPIVIRNDGLPEVVTERRIGYFNTLFDQ